MILSLLKIYGKIQGSEGPENVITLEDFIYEINDPNPLVREACVTIEVYYGLEALIKLIVNTVSSYIHSIKINRIKIEYHEEQIYFGYSDKIIKLTNLITGLKWVINFPRIKTDKNANNRMSIIVELLEEYMLRDIDCLKQDTAKEILINLGGSTAMQKFNSNNVIKDKYNEVILNAQNTVQDLFEKTISDAKIGYNFTIGMDIIMFIMGVMLIIVNAIIAFTNNSFESYIASSASGGRCVEYFISYVLSRT